ncbi:MAG: ParB/RepB/Spo0J family partition protein [Smithella sp.]
MIQLISIEKIYPHPKNPRRDLGELTELAESIKAQGILQNLTVVPQNENCNFENREGSYITVIGHRRLAAAKLAGLTEVPCTIAEMDERTQVATMLLENIQRADLTVLEQAEGFQMMMDLGETIKTISEKTGFGETTVRHRVKMNELDKKKFSAAVARGGRMEDYIALEQIQNAKLKNMVLEHIGTHEFEWQLKCALREEAKPARKKALSELLSSFAKPKTKDEKGPFEYIKDFYGYDHEGWKKPADATKEEYFYEFDSSGATLYKRSKKAESKKLSAKEKDFNKRHEKMKTLAKQAYQMRHDFIKDFTATKKYAQEITGFLVRRMLRYSSPELDKTLNMLGIEKPESKEGSYIGIESLRPLIMERYTDEPERVILTVAYFGFNDSASTDYYQARSWESKIIHESNSTLDDLYDGLISLGYELSEEEQQLRDGTHKLFDKEKTEIK